jgi:hypothetical protein
MVNIKQILIKVKIVLYFKGEDQNFVCYCDELSSSYINWSIDENTLC